MQETKTTQPATETPFIADCFVHRYNGHANVYLPAKVKWETKTVITVVTKGGTEYRFTGRRDQAQAYGNTFHSIHERGSNSSRPNYLTFAVAIVERIMDHEVKQRELQNRSRAAQGALETFFRNHRNGFGQYGFNEVEVETLEGMVAQTKEIEAKRKSAEV